MVQASVLLVIPSAPRLSHTLAQVPPGAEESLLAGRPCMLEDDFGILHQSWGISTFAGCLDVLACRLVVAQLLRALDHLHKADICHGGIDIQHVLLWSWEAVVVDQDKRQVQVPIVKLLPVSLSLSMHADGSGNYPCIDMIQQQELYD
jgi:hypothetical protein